MWLNTVGLMYDTVLWLMKEIDGVLNFHNSKSAYCMFSSNAVIRYISLVYYMYTWALPKYED